MTPRKKPEVHSKFGRPSTYKPEYATMLIDHLAEGLMYESFAGVVGCTVDNLYKWEALHSEFLYAKRLGWPRGYLFWDKLNRAISTGIKSIKINGQVVDPKNVPAAIFIFNMKNRFGWRDMPSIDDNRKDKSLTLKYALPKKVKGKTKKGLNEEE